jgi:site-specific recombinase
MLNWLRNLKRGEKYDLSSIMTLANPEGSFSDRVLWLEQLVDWLRHENQATRVKFLVQVLERNPEWKDKTGKLIASLLQDAKLVRLFTETGVPSWMTVTHEFMSQFIRAFLPRFSDDQERSGKDAFAQIFYEDLDAEWVQALPAETWAELMKVLSPYLGTQAIRDKVFSEISEAGLILAMKCGSIMVREDFAIRAPELGSLSEHPVLNLQMEFLKLKTGSEEPKVIEDSLLQMEEVSTVVKAHLERYGVSIDLVFQRERLKQYIFRIRYLYRAAIAIRHGASDALVDGLEPETPSDLHVLFLELVSGSATDQDFSHLVRKNLSLASKKIVDFTGSTGEHYIAHSPEEMRKLFWGALGGGVITAFAVMAKYGVDRSEWPMFLDFFYAAINYSVAFLIIHFLHFTLATKQPSMTAATLANKIHTRDGSGSGDEEFALEIKQLFRSQVVSIIGNIAAVVPVAFMADQAWNAAFGHHFFNEHEAEHLIISVSPWRSGALIYAMMTGFLLWLAGIASGWMENATVYHRIPKLIENHKVLRKLFGEKFAASLSKAFLKNISGVTSSVSLGFLLGAWPILGRFIGLPLDIRHVTFSSGAAAAAISSVGMGSLSGLDWLEVVLGVLLIGAFNLMFSFLLALSVAVRAKEIRFKRAWVVLRLVLRNS